MKREFCVVDDVREEDFTLKNTKEEKYRIDRSLLGDFRCGDEVLLIYTERHENEDGTFSADVQSIFPDSSVLLRPAN